MTSIPFHLPDEDSGLTETEGRLFADDTFLMITVKRSTLELFNKEQRTIKIEHNALESLTLRRGLFRDTLCLRPKSDELLDAMPGHHPGQVELAVWRIHRNAVETLIAFHERRRHTSQTA